MHEEITDRSDPLRRVEMAESRESGDCSKDSSSAGQHDFKAAKESILNTFQMIETLIAIMDMIFSKAGPEFQHIFEKYKNQKGWFSECRKFLEKEKMKAVIFGSTSSGKSTTVNAILHKRLLPAGMGHVTDCILQIEGSARKHEVTVKINKAEEEPIEDLEEYLEEKCKVNKLSRDCILYITCPTSQFHTLKNDVIILDCPGLDNTEEHDEVINNNCKDADVFVFVSDAKSTIRRTEVSFFERIEDPTVFILFNCWDLTERNERERKRAKTVRKQHMEDACKFLKKSNKHMTEEGVKDKIYFVSAEESLETHEFPRENINYPPGRHQREKEFTEFEEAFWKYTTDSALRTRFGSRIVNAQQRLKDFKENLEQILRKLDEKERKLKQVLDDLTKRDKSTEEIVKGQEKERLSKILKFMEKENIEKIAEPFEPEDKSSNDNEIWTMYYQDLHKYVQNRIKEELTQILLKCQKDAEEEDRNGLQTCLKDTAETRNDIGSLLKQNKLDWEFDLPENMDLGYSWSFGPIDLLKKHVFYGSFYKQQSTTSTSRSVLQIGGYVTAIGLAAASPFTLPVLGVGAVAVTGIHYVYDRVKWSPECKINHLQKMCAADIYFQFKEKYKSDLLKTIEELDKDLLEHFNQRLANYTNETKSMHKGVKTLNEKMKKLEPLQIISNEEEKLDAFKQKYLRPDHESHFKCAQCSSQNTKSMTSQTECDFSDQGPVGVHVI